VHEPLDAVVVDGSVDVVGTPLVGTGKSRGYSQP
jgi:hypothetical protein